MIRLGTLLAAAAVVAGGAYAAAPREYATQYFVVSLPAGWHATARSATRVRLASATGRSALVATAEPGGLRRGVAARVRALLSSIRAEGGTVIARHRATTGDPLWQTVVYHLHGRLVTAAVANDGVGDAIVVRAWTPLHGTAADRAVVATAAGYVGRADLGD